MKHLLSNYMIGFFILFLLSNLHSQTDSIYVTVHNDTATIWHTQTERNCASKFRMDIHLNNFHILLMEMDTIGPIANCICYFDLSAKIGPLSSGNYSVDVLGSDVMYGDTIFLGSATFTVPGNYINPGSSLLGQSQSECYQINTISPDREFVPTELEVSRNYPNPFNPKTSIQFQVPVQDLIEIAIYNLTGEKIETIFRKTVSPGEYLVSWDATNLPSGIYFILVKSGNTINTQKAILLK
jgi:hypothetical protein